MSTHALSNTDDTIDTRDLIARIEELKDDLGLSEGDTGEAGENLRNTFNRDPAQADLWTELEALEKVADEASASPYYEYGETLIRESYFTTYIEELINECYELPKDLNSGKWPWRHMKLDYEAAANEAKVDYIECDYDGVTYLIRS